MFFFFFLSWKEIISHLYEEQENLQQELSYVDVLIFIEHRKVLGRTNNQASQVIQKKSNNSTTEDDQKMIIAS